MVWIRKVPVGSTVRSRASGIISCEGRNFAQDLLYGADRLVRVGFHPFSRLH